MVSHSDVELFLEGTSRWVFRALDYMHESARDVLVRSCAEVFEDLAAGISEIVAERDSCMTLEKIFLLFYHTN